MNSRMLDILRCPVCASRLKMEIKIHDCRSSGHLVCVSNAHSYPVINDIPRFVGAGHYAESFGFQWKKFSKVQLDSYNGTNFSEERFQLITGWTKGKLAGKKVLDAGCGAGRFSEIAVKFGAQLVAFDLSEAVEAWQENIFAPEAFVCQASMYELPFAQGAFDYVYCIGVIQHTPNPSAAIRALCRMVKPKGEIGLWIYERDWKSFLGTLGFKYGLRPIFSRLSRAQQYKLCERMVAVFFPLVRLCKSLGLIGKIVMRLLPVASAHIQHVPISVDDFRAWVLLDTFDMYSPAYDQPQSYSFVEQLLQDEGFQNICRHCHGGISITGVRGA